VLVEVAFMDCTDAVSVLTSHLKLKVFGDCQSVCKNFCAQLSFQTLQGIFKMISSQLQMDRVLGSKGEIN